MTEAPTPASMGIAPTDWTAATGSAAWTASESHVAWRNIRSPHIPLPPKCRPITGIRVRSLRDLRVPRPPGAGETPRQFFRRLDLLDTAGLFTGHFGRYPPGRALSAASSYLAQPLGRRPDWPELDFSTARQHEPYLKFSTSTQLLCGHRKTKDKNGL